MFILASLQVCSIQNPKLRGRDAAVEGGRGGVSRSSWLMGGELPSTLLWAEKSCSTKDAAKDCMAPWLSMADHLEIMAAMTDR